MNNRVNIMDSINGQQPNRKQRRYRDKWESIDNSKVRIVRKANPTTLSYVEFLNKNYPTTTTTNDQDN